MKLNLKVLVFCALICFGMLCLFACGEKTDDPAVDPDNGEMAAQTEETAPVDKLTADVTAYFEAMYKCYNEKKYSDYISYLNISDATVAENMVNGFNTAAKYYDASCVIEDIQSKQFDDGLINVALSIISTTVSIPSKEGEEPITTKVREILYFNMEYVDDKLTVKNYTSGGSMLITE